MAGDLEVDTETKKPVGIEEDPDNQDTKGLKEVEGIPKNVCMGCIEFPLDECAYPVVNGEPKTQPQISTLPCSRYVV